MLSGSCQFATVRLAALALCRRVLVGLLPRSPLEINIVDLAILSRYTRLQVHEGVWHVTMLLALEANQRLGGDSMNTCVGLLWGIAE